MYHQNKVIFGGLIGNLVESYDLAICYFLASELANHLLGKGKNNITITLVLIFLAYLAKPFGAFFLGLFSDRYGRKRVLSVSILIVGFSTFFIGLIPTYEKVGLLAAGLFLLFRILQSLAHGSEYLNSASFLVESGHESQRGFRGSWTAVGTKLGFLLACLVASAYVWLSQALPDYDALWRWPFLLAIFTTLAGFYVRRKMPESLAYVLYYADKPTPKGKTIYRQSFRYIRENPFLFYYAFFATFFSVATGFFFYLYIPIHAGEHSDLSRIDILTASALSLILVSALTPLFGWLSDRYGRLELLKLATVGILLLSYPLLLSSVRGNGIMFILMMSLISIPCACYYSASAIILTELFPMPIRCTALSLVYSVAASLAAGVPPLIADYLAKSSRFPGSPALIIMTLALIVFCNALYLGKYYQRGRNQYAVDFSLAPAKA